MAIEVTDLDSLNSTEVFDALDRARALMAEQYPDRQVRGGAFEEVVLRADALLGTVHRTNFDRLRNSQSLKAIETDPTLADDEVLDALASNYRITRTVGANASGTAVIIISTKVDTIIAAGSQFTAPNGKVFQTTDLFTGRASASDVITSNDRLIATLSDATYAFTVSVTAVATGTAGNISIFTELTPANPPTNFIRAYAGTGFSGGVDDESTSSLISRLQTGIAHRSLCSRASIEGVIRADADYANIVGASIVGYGDAEQLRYHSIFPIAFGGRVDGYIRTQAVPEAVELTKTATLVDAGGIWQFALTRDDAPGFYEIQKVLLPTQPTDGDGFTVTQDTRGVDTTEASVDVGTAGTLFIPDISTATEGAYSRYQTATIRFQDTITSTGSLTVGVSTASYKVFVKTMPGIAEIQDIVADRAVRSPVGDCLIKAPVPCFTTVTLTINKPSSAADPDTGLIQQAVIDAVNSNGFTGKLTASRITAAVEASLAAQSATNSSVASISLAGRIRKPDGTTSNISSSTVLTISSAPADMVTGRTVAFISELTDVTVSIVPVDIPDV